MLIIASRVHVYVENGGVSKTVLSGAWCFLVFMMVFINTEYSEVESMHMAHLRQQN